MIRCRPCNAGHPGRVAAARKKGDSPPSSPEGGMCICSIDGRLWGVIAVAGACHSPPLAWAAFDQTGSAGRRNGNDVHLGGRRMVGPLSALGLLRCGKRTHQRILSIVRFETTFVDDTNCPTRWRASRHRRGEEDGVMKRFLTALHVGLVLSAAPLPFVASVGWRRRLARMSRTVP